MGVRFYGSTVGGLPREILIMGFGEYFGLEPNPARTLMALFDADGAPRTWRALATSVNSHRLIGRSSMHRAICEVRRAMEPEAVDSDERGYWLSEVGLGECKLCLDQLAVRILALSKGTAA